MSLYLDEIWLQWGSAEEAQQVLTRFSAMASGEFTYPPGVSLAAGPWFSNEEAKIVVVLDIADHAKTFEGFATALMLGLIKRRRLTPIVEWGAVDALLAARA